MGDYNGKASKCREVCVLKATVIIGSADYVWCSIKFWSSFNKADIWDRKKRRKKFIATDMSFSFPQKDLSSVWHRIHFLSQFSSVEELVSPSLTCVALISHCSYCWWLCKCFWKCSKKFLRKTFIANLRCSFANCKTEKDEREYVQLGLESL